MIQTIEKAVRARLAATTALTNVVGTRIYSTQAPAAATLPLVVYEITGGGSANVSPRDEIDVLVTVRVTATDASGASGAASAKSAADVVRAALHNAALTLDLPWAAYDVQHESAFAYVENVDRRQYYHAGGVYRLRACQ